MGVDSNVLIFERIKEELAAAQSARARGQGGLHARLADDRRYPRHVADRGGVPVSIRHDVDSWLRDDAGDRPAGERLHRGVRVAHGVRGGAEREALPVADGLAALSIGNWQLFANTRINFTRWRWHALALSLVVILAGIATVAAKGLPLGIDFSGGTLAVVEFTQDGVTEEQVRAAVAVLPGDEVVQRYGAAADRQFMIRLALGSSGADALQDTVRQIARCVDGGGPPRVRVREARAGQRDDRQRPAAPRRLRGGRLARRDRDLYRRSVSASPSRWERSPRRCTTC